MFQSHGRGVPRLRWTRAGVPLLLVASAVVLLPGTALAATICQDSGPAGGGYVMRVCITAPAEGATITGDVVVTATTAVVSGTAPGVQRMVFRLDGQYLLTDYQPTYTFTLPTAKFVDGPKTISAHALLRDTFVTADATADVTFANGVVTPPVNTNTFTPTPGTDPEPGHPFTVAVVGDGAGGDTTESDVTNLMASWNPNLVFYLGDVYEKGTPTEFYNWYRPQAQAGTFFGRFRSITDPVVGNHEYTGGEAPGYFDYWDNPPHYYSVNTHGWHVIALDTNSAFGQYTAGSPQYNWLVQDLDANTQPCTVAVFHQPLFNIGDEGPTAALSDIWALLASHGVDLVINGHDHSYQRWEPLDAAGNPSPTGITEIIDGTGGHALGTFVASDPRVAATASQFGALRLTFNPAGAGYQFVTTAGQSLDSGSVACDPSTSDVTEPSAPAGLTATSTYKTRIDLSWNLATDNVGVTGYQIYRDGSLLTTTTPQTTYADATVAPGSTHTYTVKAVDAAGNVSPASNAASASTPLSAVLFYDGFESGDMSNWINPGPTTNPVNNGLYVNQAVVFAGASAARSTSTGLGASAWHAVSPAETNFYHEAHFNAQSHTTTANLVRFRANNISASSIATVSLSTTNKLTVRNDAGAAPASFTSTAVASPGVWHVVQVHITVNGASSVTEVWLDGVALPELSKTWDLGSRPIGRVELGDPGSPTTTKNFDIAYDEVAYDREYISDVTNPTAPTGLTATAHSGLRVDLAWTPGSDDVGVTSYDVYRNGALVASSPAGSSFADTTVSPLTSYTYQLVARDLAGNASGFSNVAAVNTGDIFADGFETGTLAKWTTVSGLATQQSEVDTGNWAARATSDGTAGASAQTVLDSTTSEIYYRIRFKLISRGANSVGLVRLRTAANGALGSVTVSSAGKLVFRNDTSASSTTSTRTVSLGTWHELQLHLRIGGSNSQVDLWLDGLSAVSMTDTLGTSPIGRLELGDPSVGRTFDVAFDGILADPMFIADSADPTAPSNLHTTALDAHQVDLAWDPGTDDVGVVTYRIFRSGVPVADVDAALGSYSDSGVTEAIEYSYEVTAWDAAGHQSAPSNSVTAPADRTKPLPPTTVTTAVASDTQVVVSWSAGSDNVGVTGYRIYRDGSATPLATVGAVLSYLDTTAPPDATVTYRVRSVDATGNVSPDSSAANALTPTFADGFESGSLSKWTTVNGLLIESTDVDTGGYAAQAISSKNTVAYVAKVLPNTHSDLYYRLRLKILSGKPQNVDVLRFGTASGTQLLSIFYDSNRNLCSLNEVTGKVTTSKTSLKTSTWYEIKVHLVINGASSQVEVWVNGVNVNALSKTDSYGNTDIGQIIAGESTPGRAYNFALDNIWISTEP